MRISFGGLVIKAHIAQQIVCDRFGGRICGAFMRAAEGFHRLLDLALPFVPRGKLACEVFLPCRHDAAVGVGQLLGHGVAGVVGEPQVRIVPLHGSDHLRRRYADGALRQILRGPGVIAGSVGDDDLCLLKSGDIGGLRLEIMGVHGGRVQNGSHLHIGSADLLRKGAPLIDRCDYGDGGGLFARRSRSGRLLVRRIVAEAGGGAEHHAHDDAGGNGT